MPKLTIFQNGRQDINQLLDLDSYKTDSQASCNSRLYPFFFPKKMKKKSFAPLETEHTTNRERLKRNHIPNPELNLSCCFRMIFA